MYLIPTITDFKNYFVRDFPFGTDITANVLDADIARAISETELTINEDLFVSQNDFNTGFLLLTAHNLVMNIRASSQGLSGNAEWLTTSRSVGSVSVSEQVPSTILENPVFAMLAKTNYGAKYLMIVYPRLLGAMYSTDGATLA